MPITLTDRAPSISGNQSLHYDLIQQRLPPWLTTAHARHISVLKAFKPDFKPDVLPPPLHASAKHTLGEHWTTQNAVDQQLAHLNDIRAFAEPLLKDALQAYGDIDVLNTSIRLYSPVNLPWWVINSMPGVTSRTVTLLDAALHNFSASETFADFAFLSDEDSRGQYRTLTFTHRVTGQTLTADTFKTVCRQLDIGARYQQKVNATLGFDNPSVAEPLHRKLISSQKTALNNAAHLALTNRDISQETYTLIQTMLSGSCNLWLDGQPMEFYTLDMLETRVTGALIIAPSEPEFSITSALQFSIDALFTASPNADIVRKIVVYLPEDPDHPLKEYTSSDVFFKELTRQLRDKNPTSGSLGRSYQQFFSQFIAHEQRGRFFQQLNSLLATVRWHPSAPGDSRPNWRETPVEAPNLRIRVLPISQDLDNRAQDPANDNLWHYLYRVKLNKIANDAREIAISTEYADRMARWAWWDNLEKMLSDIFNVALLVVTPFVPFLGELMLAYTAYQILDDVFEGILDWSQGHLLEGWEHAIAVAENMIQLAIFHVGGQLTQVARVKLSPYIEGLKPIKTASGDTRLWSPDLTPYRHRNLRLPDTIPPEETGLYHHRGKKITRQGSRHYVVGQDAVSEHFHLVHPLRPNAYRPSVALNGSGACVLEGEQPRAWSNQQLMRRLGPQTEGLSASELEQIRVISGVEFGALRHMYVKNQPTPPLLADTLKRFKNDKHIRASVENIRMDKPLDPASYWFEQMVTELDGWPQEKALLVYPQSDLSGTPHRYGNPTAEGSNTLRMSTADVMSGRLPEKVVAFLDEPQSSLPLEDRLPDQEQVQALRERLAEYVEQQSESLNSHLYIHQEASSDPHIQLLRKQYPELPLSIAQRLVQHTRRRHLKVMSENQRLPLAVKNQAEELAFEATSTQIFEQFHQGRNLSAQAENLALNTLRIHTDTLANLRIEIREKTPYGDLRTHVGAQDAPHVRLLVRSRNAQYRVFNAQGKLMHGATDFYSAVFQALTTDKRFVDAERLRAWLIEKTKVPAERRLIMAEPPIRVHAQPETLILLGGGNTSTLRGTLAEDTSSITVQQRIKKWLPEMSEQGVRDFSMRAESEEGLKILEHLEAEGQQFETTLDTFVRSKTRWPAGSRLEAVERKRRADFSSALLDAWQQGYTKRHEYGPLQGRGVRLDLSEMQWPDKLPVLPIEMTEVTSLLMTESGFVSAQEEFLQSFPNLHALDLAGNQLEKLPPVLSRLSQLRQLNLSHNKITLDAPALEHLRKLTRLRQLDLSNNPLGITPDISLMPDLNLLRLSHTGISEWPTGLFEQTRNEGFILELQGNPIADVPDVAEDSASATVIALTRLDRSSLSINAQKLFETYRVSNKLDPHRTYEPQGDSSFWIDDLDDEHKALYKSHWNNLEREHGSQGFFEVIKAMEPPEFFEESLDEVLYTQNSALLRTQVRTMLSAMHADGELREKLFRLSNFPGLCPDAGLQIFNGMGIEVEASQARLFSHTPAEQEGRLLTLAKGAARLKLLNHVARSDIAQRLKPVSQGGLGLRLTSQVVDGEPGTVDEVEVHLAYQTRLARRLGLPWVSEHMLYRSTAGVSETAITRAYTAVLALSEGDGLVDQMLLEPYWERFLKEHYATDYEANEKNIDDQFNLLDQLHDELQAYANPLELSQEQRAQKQETVKEQVQQLSVEDRVPLEEAMSDERYGQLLNDLGERRKEWLREQTRVLLASSSE